MSCPALKHLCNRKKLQNGEQEASTVVPRTSGHMVSQKIQVLFAVVYGSHDLGDAQRPRGAGEGPRGMAMSKRAGPSQHGAHEPVEPKGDAFGRDEAEEQGFCG